jgi:hypothetical protein
VILALGACGDDGEGTPKPTAMSCDTAASVADPGTAAGDTRSHTHQTEGTCITGEAPEAYYIITPARTGMLDLTLESVADLGLYVRSACADAGTEIGCADTGTGGEVETLSVPVTEGQPVWVIVDGYAVEDAGAFTLSAESRAITCGDGRVEGDETCDPPDSVTCTPECQGIPEICNDGADNDGDLLTDCEDADDCITDTAACPIAGVCGAAPAALPSDAGDTSTGGTYFAGSCTGDQLAPEELRSFLPPEAGVLLVTLDSATNQGVYVRSDCDDPTSELGCLDDAPGGAAEMLVVPVEGGGLPVSIFVDGAEPGQAGPFTLLTEHRPAEEVEPNGGPGTASDFADPYVAAIYPAGEEDYIRVQINGQGTTLVATVTDFGNGDCANFKLDSVLEIYAADGTTSLAFNDDAGDFCSRAEATGLAAGDYFVRVAASRVATRPIFAYLLTVEITP